MKYLKRFVVGPIRNNCYLVEHLGKIILIDAPAPVDRVVRYLDKHELKLDYIFITHIHYDHILGLEELHQKYPEALVYMSDIESHVYNDEYINFGYRHDLKPHFSGKVNRYDDLEMDGVSIDYIVGHSLQSACINIENYLFSGDTLFFETIGISEIPFGDHTNLVHDIKTKLLTKDEATKVFPGHGLSTTIGHEKEKNLKLKGVQWQEN